MNTGLKDKKALITGGGTGIGKAIALALANEGVHVAIANRGSYPKTIKEIASIGVKVLGISADVSKEKDVKKMIKEAIGGLGGLDLYINNVAAHRDEPVTKITTEGWLNSINTNLSACVWSCRDIAKHFISQGHGSILIIASVALYNCIPKEASYRISKSGLKPYMEILALELAPFGIRVNMISPGLFITRMTKNIKAINRENKSFVSTIPLRRTGSLDNDIGPAAILLLSDKLSAYITGSELIVDGGFHILSSPKIYTDEELRKMNSQ